MNIRQKLKKVPVPGFIKRIQLDKRLQAVLAFVAVLCCLLLFFHLYNMKYVSSLRYDSTVVTDSRIVTELQQGTAENGTIRWMSAFPEGEAVYRRGSAYFIGDKYERVQSSMPMLADHGTYLNTFGGDTWMYMEDWSQQQGFAGMFISDGAIFNYDGGHTGDDKALFLQLSNGLYMNAQTLTLEGSLHRLVIEKNSYLYIGTEDIRFYGQEDGLELVYGSMAVTYDMNVSIGGQTLTYEELLRYLGIIGEEGDFTPIPEPEDIEEAEEEEPEIIPGTEGNSQGGSTGGGEDLEDTEEDSEEDSKNKGQSRPSKAGAGQTAAAPSKAPSSGSAGGNASKKPSSSESASDKNDGKKDDGSDSKDDSEDNTEKPGDDSNTPGSGTATENVPGNNEGSAGTPADPGDKDPGFGDSSGPDAPGDDSQQGDGSPVDPGDDKDDEGDKDPNPNPDKPETEKPEKPADPEGKPGSSDNPEYVENPDDDWGGETPEGDGSDKPGGGGNPGGDTPVKWRKPQIRFKDLETDVYLLTGTMEVNDRAFTMSKVILNFEWDGEVKYRRTVKEAGDFYADNLPPDTKITVTPVLYYFNEDGIKVEEYQNGTRQEDGTVSEDLRFEITMKSRTEMDYIYFQFSDDIGQSSGNVWYENQLSSYKMQLSSKNKNTVNKITKMTMEIYKKGESQVYATTTVRANSLQAYFENETGLDYLTLRSQAVLDPDTEYMYSFHLIDPFGVELPNVAWGYIGASLNKEDEGLKVTGYEDPAELPTDLYAPKDPVSHIEDKGVENEPHWAYSHTCKTKPSATVKTAASKTKKENLSEIKFTVKVNDPCEALIPLSGGAAGMPELDGEAYNIYYQVFESSALEQPLLLNELPETEEEVVVEIENEDGTTTDKTIKRRVLNAAVSQDQTGSEKIYLNTDSFDAAKWEDLVYHLEGLTAGKSYEIRVYADYDLNDNKGATRGELIGSSSFSTITLSSYGRIYYSFESSHIKTPYGPNQQVNVNTYNHEKYESSTAQQIRMKLGNRTNEDLVENFYDGFDATFQLKTGDKDEILNLSFHKEAQENGETGLKNHMISFKEADLETLKANGTIVDDHYIVQLQGTDLAGVPGMLDEKKNIDFLYSVGTAADYKDRYTKAFDSQLQLQMEIPLNLFKERFEGGGADKYLEISLWDAFANKDFATSPSIIQFTFEEGSVNSFTAYTLATVSTAQQGGEEHIVTATSSSGRQVSFTTLKNMPYVTIPEGKMLQVGKYLYILDMELHDTDNSIQNGMVTITNRLASSRTGTTRTCQLDYSTPGGRIARIEFNNLREDSDYVLEIAPNDIRRTGKTATYRYLNEVLRTITYRTGQGLTGKITMTGISYPLNQLSKGTDYHTLPEFNRYEVGNFQYGFPVITDGKVAMSEVAYSKQTMDPIAVEPGQVYYLKNLGHDGHLVMLDGDKNPVGGVRRVYNEGLIKIPDGIYYIQASMTSAVDENQRKTVYNCARAQVLLVYDPREEFKQLNGLKIVSAPQPEANSYTLDVKAGDLVAVVSTEWNTASAGNSSISGSYTIKDKDGKTITEKPFNQSYKGFNFKVGSGAAKVEISITTPLYNKDGSSAMPDVRVIDKERLDAFSDYNYDALITNYTVNVEDKGGNLVSSPEVYVAVFEAESAEPSGSCDVDATSGPVCSGSWKLNSSLCQTDKLSYDSSNRNIPFDKNYTFQAVQGHSYSMILYVKWMGDYYKLDEQSFTAEGAIYTISSGTQLMKTVAWPNAKFMVVDDLIVDGMTRTILNQRFNGQLDGQGYTLKTRHTGNYSYVFPSVGASGVIENLDITEIYDGRAANHALDQTGFVSDNHGTIRNVVVHVNLGSGNYRHWRTAGICLRNYGMIENAAIYFESESTVKWAQDQEPETYVSSGRWGYECGGAAVSNYGTIRNAIVHSGSYLTMTTGVYKGTDAVSAGNVGGIAGSNDGIIENVMALFSMAGERNSSQLSIGALNSMGLISGTNNGRIYNSFTTGDLYYMEWDGTVRVNTPISEYRSWPGAAESNNAHEKNCHYFSADSYRSNNEYTRYQSNALALTTKGFYDSSINRSGQFVVQEQLDMGFFPIIQMPECMEGAQKDLQLSSAVAGAVPTYVSGMAKEIHYPGEEITAEAYQALPAAVQQYYVQEGDVWKVQRQYAVAQISMSNLGGYEIQKLNVRYLDSAVIGQTNAEGKTLLDVVLTPASLTTANGYTSQHVVESFVYGTGEGYNRTVSSQTLAIDFYMPLAQDTWLGAPVAKGINYMLVEDVVFDAEHFGNNLGSAVNKFAASDFQFTGTFDGRGHTLDYSKAEINATQPWLVYQLSGGSVWKDVNVKGMTLPQTSAEYEGYIRSAQTGAQIQGIHFTDPKLEGAYRYGGVLAASAGTVIIRDCTVSSTGGSVEVKSAPGATGLYLGGLIGCGPANGSIHIENCYLSDLVMDVTQGVSVNGVGGMAGYLGAGGTNWNFPIVSGCYVSGKIDTMFFNCGGLVGRGHGQYGNIWTDVDINGTGNVGALVGYAGSYNNIFSGIVVNGELYSSTSSIANRLVGKWPQGTPANAPFTYAYSGQLLNTEASTETLGVEGLGNFKGDAGASRMNIYQFWWDNAGFSTEVFDVYGSESAGIPDVKTEAVYPVLYNYEHTELLPNQKAHYYESKVLDMRIVSAEATTRENEGAGGSYDLKVVIQVPVSGSLTTERAYYEQNIKGKLSADGLVFHEDDPADIELSVVKNLDPETQEEKDYLQITYKNVDAVKRFDSYRVVFAYSDNGSEASVSGKLIFKDTVTQEETPLYWHVGGETNDKANAEEWEALTKDHGAGFENFRIFDDMDFDGISLNGGLKINRLEGAKKPDEDKYDLMDEDWVNTAEYCAIKNLNIRNSQNWISEIGMYMGYLDFRNVTSAYAQSSQDYAGVIGKILGEASNLDFCKVTISTTQGNGNYNYMGCIAYADGTLENVRVADVKYTNTNFYYNYVGGLCGFARDLKNIHAFATDPENKSYYVAGGALANITYSRNYTGGISGYIGALGENLYADGLVVIGNQYVGGVSGEICTMNGSGGYRGSDNSLRMNVEVRNCNVQGRGGVGGAFGTGNYSYGSSQYNIRVMGTSVYTNGSDAGGVMGSGQGGYYLEAYNCTVQAVVRNAGGLIGRCPYSTTLVGSKAYNCTVKTGSYAGGLLGNGHTSYAINFNNSAVSKCTIEAVNDYAGGLTGCISTIYGSTHGIYHNAVSETAITGGNNVGGLSGAAAGARIYENEVDDSVTVKGSLNYTGGVVGYSSGGMYYGNIVGCSVEGKNYVGGLSGYMVGYGVSLSKGGYIVDPVSKAYKNVIACKSIKGEDIVCGLIGTFISGEEPMDGDGNIIPNSGWTLRMEPVNYYANVIVPKAFECGGSKKDWYANYEDNTFTLLNKPSYDRISADLAAKMQLSVSPYAVSGGGGITDYSGWLSVTEEDLKKPEFYTGKLADGGLAMGGIDTSDVSAGWYPYVKSSYTPVGGTATVSIVYQKAGDLTADIFNSYFDEDGKRRPFAGTGIPVSAAATTMAAVRGATDNTVYASGPDTVNLDFTNVGTQYLSFEIRDTEGNVLLPEQTIRSETEVRSNYVFTMKYGFQKDFVVTIYTGDHAKSLSMTYLAENIRKTVMAWNGEYYYLKSDGVYKAVSTKEEPKLCEEGTFVNLYNGKALRDDGEVVRLD